jgi:hypothetical protein
MPLKIHYDNNQKAIISTDMIQGTTQVFSYLDEMLNRIKYEDEKSFTRNNKISILRVLLEDMDDEAPDYYKIEELLLMLI